MSFLDTLTPRDTRRLVKMLQDESAHLGHGVASGFDSVAERVREFAEPTLRSAQRTLRREAPVVANAAMHQAARLARSAKADPVPVVVGAVGLVLLASLVFGRRRP